MIKQFKQLFKESALYGMSNFITKASGIILLPIYFSYISTEEFGLLALLETLFMFLLAFTGCGVKGGYTRWFYDVKHTKGKKVLFFTTYSFNSLTSFIGVIIVGFVCYQFPIFQYQQSYFVLILFSISSLFKLWFDVPFILLKLHHRAKRQSLYQSINVLLTIAFTFFFLEIKKEGFTGIFKAQLIANGLTLLMVLPLVIKSSVIHFHGPFLKKMIQYGYPLALSNILTIVLTLSDRYIIEHFYSLTDVGSFSMAFKISNLLQFLAVSSFITSFTYNYYKTMNNEDGAKFHQKSFYYFVFLMCFIGLAVVLYSKEAIQLLGRNNTDLYSAIPVIPVLILGLIFSGMRQVFVLPVTKAKKTHFISIVMISAGVLNIVLNFIFVPYFGQLGAAITTGISQLGAAISFYVYIRNRENIHYDFSKIFKALGITSVFCLISLYIPDMSTIATILIKIVVLVLFMVILYIIGFFDQKEKEIIRSVLRMWNNPKQVIRGLQKLKN
jgi:O-antigen/teichoic acid export membrane protein